MSAIDREYKDLLQATMMMTMVKVALSNLVNRTFLEGERGIMVKFSGFRLGITNELHRIRASWVNKMNLSSTIWPWRNLTFSLIAVDKRQTAKRLPGSTI